MEGLNIHTLNSFIDNCGGNLVLKSLSTFEVWSQFVVKELKGDKASYISSKHVDTNPLIPTLYVIHSWYDKFLDVVDILRQFVSKDSSINFYFDIFCFNLCDVELANQWLRLEINNFTSSVLIMTSCHKKNNPLSRTSCLFQMYAFIQNKIPIHMIFSQKLFHRIFNIIHRYDDNDDVNMHPNIIATNDSYDAFGSYDVIEESNNLQLQDRDKDEKMEAEGSSLNVWRQGTKQSLKSRSYKIYDVEDAEPTKLNKRRIPISYLNKVFDLFPISNLSASHSHDSSIRDTILRSVIESCMPRDNSVQSTSSPGLLNKFSNRSSNIGDLSNLEVNSRSSQLTLSEVDNMIYKAIRESLLLVIYQVLRTTTLQTQSALRLSPQLVWEQATRPYDDIDTTLFATVNDLVVNSNNAVRCNEVSKNISNYESQSIKAPKGLTIKPVVITDTSNILLPVGNVIACRVDPNGDDSIYQLYGIMIGKSPLADVLSFLTKLQSLALLYSECAEYTKSFMLYSYCYHIYNRLSDVYIQASASIHQYCINVLFAISSLYEQLSLRNNALVVLRLIYLLKYKLLATREYSSIERNSLDSQRFALCDVIEQAIVPCSSDMRLTPKNSLVESSMLEVSHESGGGGGMNIYEQEFVCTTSHFDILDNALHVLYKFAGIICKAGLKNQAEILYLQCYIDRKDVFGETSPAALRSLGQLVQFYQSISNRGKQLKFSSELTKLQKQINEGKYIQTKVSSVGNPTSIFSVAMYYERNGNYAMAGIMLMKGLDILDSTLGPYHKDTLQAMHSLGNVCYRRGDYAKARELYEMCLAKRIINFGEMHSDTLSTLSNLGSVNYQQGKYVESIALHEQCYKARTALFGIGHLDTLCSLNNLGTALSAQGLYDEAEEALLLCHKWRLQILGPQDTESLRTKESLAVLYSNWGKLSQVQAFYEDIVHILVEVDPHSKESITAMEILGSFYVKNKVDLTISEHLCQTCLQHSIEAFGDDDVLSLKCLYNLGTVYYSHERYEEAERYYLQCLQRTKVIFGNHHDDTLTSMNNVAKVYQKLGKLSQSKALFEECYELRTIKYGVNHPICTKTLASLESVEADIKLLAKQCSPLYQVFKVIQKNFPFNNSKISP